MRGRSFATVGLCAAAWCVRAQAPADQVFYTRADVVSSAAGEVSLRRAYTRQIDLLSATCPGKPFTCSADQMYGQVYLLAFVEEITSRGEDGKPSVERRDRGRLAIAVSFPKKNETTFEDALTTYLKQLGVPEFEPPRAGMEFLEKPFEKSVLEKSGAPAWVCTELDGEYHYDVASIPCPKESPAGKPIPPDTTCLDTFGDQGDKARTACGAIERAARDAEPEVFRTLPDIRAQRRHEVRLATASTLSGRTWADRLAKVPEGATFRKAKLDDNRMTGGVRDIRDGVYLGHEGRYGGVELDVRLPAARLELEGVPMWMARFTFERTLERFGENSSIERDPAESLLVAVAPIADQLMNELARARTDLTVPDDRLRAAALARLQRSATLDSTVVSEVLTDPEVWPSRGSWLVVTCRDDGSARYGIAPFAEAAEVTNAREVCAAIRREIGE